MIEFSRRDWGAQKPLAPMDSRERGLVIFHHAWRPHFDAGVSLETERNAVRGIEKYHADKGWLGIGYNFLIFQSGHVYEGRGWHRTGAHTSGANARSVGVCFVINGDEHPLTDAAKEAARALLTKGRQIGALADGYEIKGHCDYSSKSCPGALVYPFLEELRG